MNRHYNMDIDDRMMQQEELEVTFPYHSVYISPQGMISVDHGECKAAEDIVKELDLEAFAKNGYCDNAMWSKDTCISELLKNKHWKGDVFNAVQYFENNICLVANEIVGTNGPYYQGINFKVTIFTKMIEGKFNIDQSFANIVPGKMIDTATHHMEIALEELEKEHPNYAYSISESLKSTEAICRQILLNKNITLGDALREISKTRGLSKTLYDAFAKLYGWANTEQGIRHGLFEIPTNELKEHDARLMVELCISMNNYLTRAYGLDLKLKS